MLRLRKKDVHLPSRIGTMHRHRRSAPKGKMKFRHELLLDPGARHRDAGDRIAFNRYLMVPPSMRRYYKTVRESLLGRQHGQALVEYVRVVAAIALTFLSAVVALFILLAQLEGQ